MPSDYQILISAKDSASAAFQRARGEVARTSLAVNDLGKTFGFSEGRSRRFISQLFGATAAFGLAKTAIGAMKKELDSSVKAYEEFGRATGRLDIKAIDELREKHELLRIEVGEKLFPLWVNMEGVAMDWLRGVGILIDKIGDARRGLQSSSSGTRWGDVPTDNPADYKGGRFKQNSEDLHATTKAQRDAADKAAKEAEKQRQDAKKLADENRWYDYEAKKKHDEAIIKEAEETAQKLAEIDQQIADAKEQLAEETDRQDRARRERAKEDEIAAKYMVMEAQRGFAASTAQILTLMGGENKKYVQGVKALAISEAVISTAVAAAKANSATPYPPVNALLMAEAIVQGGVEIATIAAQNFARGGIVGGNSYSGDNVRANVNSGEMILNARQQAMLYAQANGTTTTNNATSNITIHVNDSLTGERLIKLLRSGELRNAAVELARYQRNVE